MAVKSVVTYPRTSESGRSSLTSSTILISINPMPILHHKPSGGSSTH